ncbi:Alkaline phosphatase synthesis transcriptional regulatory protein phoP [Phocoenobacter uteri]|uniref:Alkaline phosphatase synthesis transcriptional regulatory protein phoP n=1 Tax=Phocoenobacter uteri TaxID=146806 RepID=A0A379C998_9PAST|nr:response regulator [Phocoenobacter uteri]MDG6882586.1 DNA-binding response regulator [Phocoenobacter uteri]SUB58749.1 Alkaline phosphatase synthesis transcriptional regulatory protein phoP [Phocoenobacter uteri]
MSKILLVDDDITLTQSLMKLLTLENFEIQAVHNGQDTLARLEAQQYDLILLDINMPILNGIETLKQIRQKYQTPVLMVSTRNQDIDRILAFDLGADDYLAKPFNERELVARVKAILRRSMPSSTNKDTPCKKIMFCGIELNINAQQARYNQQDLQLTSTEFLLFSLFVDKPNTLFSRDVLSLKILGKELSPYDRAIDMHISNLRKKLPKRKDSLAWFKTIRGKGYLLIAESM